MSDANDMLVEAKRYTNVRRWWKQWGYPEFIDCFGHTWSVPLLEPPQWQSHKSQTIETIIFYVIMFMCLLCLSWQIRRKDSQIKDVYLFLWSGRHTRFFSPPMKRAWRWSAFVLWHAAPSSVLPLTNHLGSPDSIFITANLLRFVPSLWALLSYYRRI